MSGEQDDKDLWENLELGAMSAEDSKKQEGSSMTIADFLGQGEASAQVGPKAKQSSYHRKEITGTREERIAQINEYGKSIRPAARVVGLLASPNRNHHQIATLVEVE